MNDNNNYLTDARVENNNKNTSFDCCLNPKPNEPIGHLTVAVHDMAYNMKHAQRGKCLIFNHQYFDPQTGCKPRDGTDFDAQSISSCFRNLQFQIIQYKDASYRKIREILTKISKEDHSDRDCLVITILTHGDEDSLWARDVQYPIDNLVHYLSGDKCPTLAGKPKIFIIQACRGEEIDSGVKIKGMDRVDGVQPINSYRIPTFADFLIYYSTAPGFYSFRNPSTGSCFINALVMVLDKYATKYDVDLLTLLTVVNQKVAYYFESNTPDRSKFHKKKQIPCIASMLTRLVFFPPKEYRNKSLI